MAGGALARLMLLALAAVAGGAQYLPPGQGTWYITSSTVRAEGEGCDVDWLEIEVGDVRKTVMVSEAQRDVDCSPGSNSCLYYFLWKCAKLDTHEKRPEEQKLAVMIDLEGKTAKAVTPQYDFASFDGQMHVVEEEYTVSNVMLKGTQTWKWTSADGKHVCQGQDQIVGRPGTSMSCDFWWEENEDGAEIPRDLNGKVEADKRAGRGEEALLVEGKKAFVPGGRAEGLSGQPDNDARSEEEQERQDARDAYHESLVHLPYAPDESTTEDGVAIEQFAAPMITEMMFLLAIVPICGILVVYLRRRNFRISMDLGTGNSSVSLLMRDGNVAYQYS